MAASKQHFNLQNRKIEMYKVNVILKMQNLIKIQLFGIAEQLREILNYSVIPNSCKSI
jgi:hypothetical protein